MAEQPPRPVDETWEVDFKGDAAAPAGSAADAQASLYPPTQPAASGSSGGTDRAASDAPPIGAGGEASGGGFVDGLRSLWRWWKGEKEDDGIARLIVRARQHHLITNRGKKPYVLYDMAVVHRGAVLQQTRLRFSDMRKLHVELRRAFPDAALPSFPGRSIVADMTDPGNIAERMRALDRYFAALLELPDVLELPLFHETLRIGEDGRRVAADVAAALRKRREEQAARKAEEDAKKAEMNARRAEEQARQREAIAAAASAAAAPPQPTAADAYVDHPAADVPNEPALVDVEPVSEQ